MDTLKDFFSELKDRISNPFVFSFITAWVFWNYPIAIGLIFYKQAELCADGYNSYLDLIKRSPTYWTLLIWPLFIAFVYTFAFPFFKSQILIFNSWLMAKTNTSIYTKTKRYVVTVEFHNNIVKILEKEKADFVNLIATQSSVITERDGLKAQIDILNANHQLFIIDKNKELDSRINDINLANDSRITELRKQNTERIKEMLEIHEELVENGKLKETADRLEMDKFRRSISMLQVLVILQGHWTFREQSNSFVDEIHWFVKDKLIFTDNQSDPKYYVINIIAESINAVITIELSERRTSFITTHLFKYSETLEMFESTELNPDGTSVFRLFKAL